MKSIIMPSRALLLLLLCLLAASSTEALRLRRLSQYMYGYAAPRSYSAPTYTTKPATYFNPNRGSSYYQPPKQVYIPAPPVTVMQPTRSSYVDKCKIWWEPGCPGADPRGSSSQPSSSSTTAGRGSTSDFTYSSTLVDQIINTPDAAFDNVMKSLDRGGDEVEKVVNSMLKAAETWPCKVADVLAKVAKVDANKYAMVSGQGMHTKVNSALSHLALPAAVAGCDNE
jgi:hypothetical protein